MATATPAKPTPTLSFPRPIFAALSPHPFLQAHLTSTPNTPLRANGRTAQETRPIGVNTDALTHSHGSAVVRMGNTVAVCGVRGEILRAEDAASSSGSLSSTADSSDDDDEGGEEEQNEMEQLRLLVPNIELSTGSTPAHIPGSAPSTLAQTLVTRLRALLLSTHLVRLSDLRIAYTPPANPDEDAEAQEVQVKGYWVLYIDTMFLALDGSAFDCAWLAMLAALRATLLPHAFWDEELETILCSDEPEKAARLRLRGLPVPSSFAVFEGSEDGEGVEWVLSDPDAFEDSVCRESVCVVVDGSQGKGLVRRVEKSGGGLVDRENIKVLFKKGMQRWKEWEKVLEERK
ncbi:exoribonuclease family protein [Polyplosphaeria fusca]|uniref:Ribosomal RNA-processing protein 43 n=1 Tax=Polyplosphaeria fusca TaxID=682080 RepID=A0A9P4R8E5_9PLEO|nr:exoribonuclease family protein [Polyplosphaeria fusca]